MTKKIQFADVFIEELTLNIFRGAFDKEVLQVVKRKDYKIGDYDVELAIIGASHYISISKNKEVIFSEVFACVDIQGATQYKDKRLRGVKNNVFDYSFCSYIFEIDQDKTGTVDRFKRDNTLVFEFGQTPEFKESAITGLILNEKDGKMELETIHVYPNENKAIVTNSSFDLRGHRKVSYINI